MIRLVLQHQKHDILNIKTEESLVFFPCVLPSVNKRPRADALRSLWLRSQASSWGTLGAVIWNVAIKEILWEARPGFNGNEKSSSNKLVCGSFILSNSFPVQS